MAVDKEKRRREMEETMRGIRKDFEDGYAAQIEGLKGLSDSDIAAIMPGSAGKEAYASLCAIVEECSQKNLSQADLKTRIEALGETAVSIAKKVRGLASIF